MDNLKYIKTKLISLIIFISYLINTSLIKVFAKGDVSKVIEETWKNAESQIRQVVNNVIFPAISIVLAIFLFVKLGSSYFDYKKNNDRFEWTSPAILFVGLVFSLTAPTFIWRIL